MRHILFLLFFSALSLVQAQIENYFAANKTPEYHQVIRFYDSIAKTNPQFKLFKGGATDAGLPLNLFVISKQKVFDVNAIHKQKKAVLFINNGIHPGEPDGIDACIQLVRNFAKNPKTIPDSVVICIVPVYNIDGALQRNSVMRMNQNGPEEFGFRGNGKNLDLNRDFVKCDAENTKSLLAFFHHWKPHVFIDTHVSNGADYEYTMTLIYPNAQKYCANSEVPSGFAAAIVKKMSECGAAICPYVESISETPDSGIYEFNQTPRYCTGFTSLFNCISMVTETHMLKAYPERVKATLQFLTTTIDVMQSRALSVNNWKKKCEEECAKGELALFNWKNNSKESSVFRFSGYEAMHKTSSISGLERLYYDRDKPWKKEIPFYNKFIAADTVKLPSYYVIPQAWNRVIENLKTNNIKMNQLKKDTVIACEVDYITDFKTSQRPYEGHYVHSQIKTRKEIQKIRFLKGDYLVQAHQPGSRYLAEVLEPRSDDGFFAWNFFDAILQQKEWFSDYVFEEVAEQILKEEPAIKLRLDSAKAADKNLSTDHWSQLNFIFQHSKYKEKSHNRYPVARIR